jgi:hypothetical protein
MNSRSSWSLAVVAALCVAGSAHAQTASAEVRIVRIPGGANTLVFPGVGSNTLRFATGSFTLLSGTSTGSASSGGGSISTFAAGSDFGAQTGSPLSMGTTSTGSLTDSFTVTADTVLPLRLEFGIRASGTVSTVRTVPVGIPSGSSSAEVQWSVGLTGPGTNISVAGLIREQQFADTTNVNTIQRTETGLGFSTFAATIELLDVQVGQSFTLSMSSLAKGGYNKGVPGSTVSGAADFGSTLRWLGLTKAEFLDGTPFTGAIQISSASGHDYLARFNDCPADLNADQQVDDADFVQFAGAYNILDCADPAMPANCPADLNNDDAVDDADFSVFVVAYDEVICP